MRQHFDLLLHGATVFTPTGLSAVSVGINAGRIAAVGLLSGASADEILELAGLTVLPGVIDSQVHFREPGLEYKEDLETGTRAAALGGIVAVCEMPNTNPNTDSAERLAGKLKRAHGRAFVDHAFFVGATDQNAHELAALEWLPGCAGIKIFMGSSTGSLLVENDEVLDAVLAHGHRRVAVHCEDEARLRERRALTQTPDATAHLHPIWRDEVSALRATERLVALATKRNRPVHVLHVSTESEMLFLAKHREIATVEVLPQHLLLAAPECYDRLGNYAQMNPPIRDARHQQALWAALRTGLVDVIGSDHAPHTREEKDRPYPNSPSGLTGVQTMVPLMLDAVHRGLLSLSTMVDLLSSGPARVYGMLRKGRIEVGFDADFTVVDLNRPHTITHAEQASKAGWTPFDGTTVTGMPVLTMIRGKVVMREGELLGTPIGEPIRFH